MRWGIKNLLIKTLDELISPIRERRRFYENNMELVIQSIEEWSKNARKIGQKVLTELKNKMGITRYGYK